eukprot:TRINITY_DN91441_c0_g1_i1.p1 TRINITY_DN91441_c0_g1~~TRINITY_DN91441_c0_g1_i1.p1  ORF type:complete len:410 (+),score=42.57 TRINITY_DN91441_c0_g1_i1:35-1264(+)
MEPRRVTSAPRQRSSSSRPLPRPSSAQVGCHRRVPELQQPEIVSTQGRPPLPRSEPRPGRACTRSPVRPASAKCSPRLDRSSPETIVVQECDFKRYGNDLSKLRECQLPPWEDRPKVESQETEPPVTFAQNYAQLCRKRHAEIRDPWKDVPNPESSREVTVNDRIVNQVWVDSPRDIESKPGQTLWAVAKRNIHAIAPRLSLPARAGPVPSTPRVQSRNSCCSRGTSATRAESCDPDPEDSLSSSGGSCEVALLDVRHECIGAESTTAKVPEKENIPEMAVPMTSGDLCSKLQASAPASSQSLSSGQAAQVTIEETRTDVSQMPGSRSRPRSAFAYRSLPESGALKSGDCQCLPSTVCQRPANLRLAARAVLQERSLAKSQASRLTSQSPRPVMPADFLISSQGTLRWR